jgi:uncharacterized membrane protein
MAGLPVQYKAGMRQMLADQKQKADAAAKEAAAAAEVADWVQHQPQLAQAAFISQMGEAVSGCVRSYQALQPNVCCPLL